MQLRRIGALILVLLAPGFAVAGEIPGLPSMSPLFLERQLELGFSNDFLGRGGSVDDFRTQQITVTAALGERWLAVLDHSVLTLTDSAAPGRIDQLSTSIGYRLFDAADGDVATRLLGGVGLRGVGDYAGERMQNGFHRLIDSDVENLPYSGIDETYLTAWADVERYAVFRRFDSGWRLGWDLRGRALVTSDGQFDATAAATLVTGRGFFDAWGGLRQDWRSGYDEPVQRATAAAEQDLAIVFGFRLGSLVLETVQQVDNDASFGQLRFLAAQQDAPPASAPPARLGLELAFLVPDVHLRLAARWRTRVLLPAGSAWRESLVLSIDTGEPQHDAGPSVFIDSTQVGVGLEWERPLGMRSQWISAFVSFGAGWREERLLGDAALAGAQSASADSAVVLGGAGLRFHASTLGGRWRYRIQAGLSTWLPLDQRSLTIDSLDLDVLEPGLGLSVGFTFDFS